MASVKKLAPEKKTGKRAARTPKPRRKRARAPHGGALVVVVDPNARVVRWNAAFEAACGKGHDLAGKSAHSVLTPGDKSGRLSKTLKKVLSGKGGLTFESPLPASDGAQRSILWTASDCRDATGAVKQVVCAGIDITADKRTRELADQRQQELLHLYRLHSAGGLAAAMAHELAQPLSALVSYCEACGQTLNAADPDLSRLRRNLQRAIGEAHRAADIIRELRSFILKRKSEPEPVKLTSAIATALKMVGPVAKARNIRVETKVAAKLPRVEGRRVQIEQLLVNLLNNAIDSISASRPREGCIRISAQTDPAGTARVSIADNGAGLNDDVARRMFNPFYTTREGGLGIGLMIARSIAEAHGGRLWAESAPAGGAIFHFTAPFWR